MRVKVSFKKSGEVPFHISYEDDDVIWEAFIIYDYEAAQEDAKDIRFYVQRDVSLVGARHTMSTLGLSLECQKQNLDPNGPRGGPGVEFLLKIVCEDV